MTEDNFFELYFGNFDGEFEGFDHENIQPLSSEVKWFCAMTWKWLIVCKPRYILTDCEYG